MESSNLKCEICEKIFQIEQKKTRHIRSVHGKVKNLKYICNVCDKKFERENQLNLHIANYHLKGPNFKCDFCGKSYSTIRDLCYHKKIHTLEKQFKCTICQKGFLNHSRVGMK